MTAELTLDLLDRHFERLLVVTFALGALVLVGSAFTGTGGDVIVGDARYYFEYARSIVVDHSLPSTYIKYPLGVSLIGLIGYAPLAGLSKALIAAGILQSSSRWETGWALPLQLAFCAPLIALAFVGVRANASMFARLGYPSRVVRPAILMWILATNIGFYMLKEPAMSESATYATLSLYYWCLIRWFHHSPAESAPAGRWVARAAMTGVLLGLAGAVRQQNILHCVALPILLFSPRDRRPGRAILAIAACALASAAIFALPYVGWFAGTGSVKAFSYAGEQFNFLSPHPVDALFHPGYHGLFVWHPAFALAAAGLFLFLRTHSDVRWAWLVPIGIQFYLVSSWYWLSFGASVGHRGFFTILPLLAAGWVAFADACMANGRSRALVLTSGGLIVINAIVTVALMTGRLSPIGLPPRT